MLEAFALAHSEIIRICDAIDELAREVGKEKWIDVELNAELEARHGEAVARRIAEVGLRESAIDRRRAARSRRPRRSRWTRPRSDIVRELQVRNGLADAAREASGSRRSRARSARSSRTSSARSPTRSRTRRSSRAASATSFSRRIQDEVAAAVPGRRRRRARQGRDHAQLRQEGRRRDLQGPRPQEDRGREASPGRSRHGGDPADHDRGRRLAADARLGAVHAWPDADPHALHARHREGAAADRRPVDRAGAPLHPPLQLPALLGRGDGLHARPEAP